MTKERRNVGPHGLGDPDDLSLRRAEKDIVIPKRMKDTAHTEKCVAEVEEFKKCGIEAGLTITWKCKEPIDNLNNCLVKWLKDEDFKKRITTEYLNERSEYRRTGIRTNKYLKIK